MNQDDFRRLLDSGGGGNKKHGGARGGQDNITSLDADGIRKLQSKKSSKKKSTKPHKDGGRGDGDGGDEDGRARHSLSQYRDRAAERRQGLVTDMVDADEFKHFDADQSKFLGGDMAHTHLVKGLDVSLLAQLKLERQKLEQATAAEKMKRMGNDGVTPGSQESNEAGKGTEPTFQTRLGRMIYLHISQNRPLSKDAQPIKSELFLPGRMYYTFNLLSQDFESVPTAVQRSKEDCPELDDMVTGLVDDMTISEVKRVLEEKHTTKKMRRKRDDSKTNDGKDDHSNAHTAVEGQVESVGAVEEAKVSSDDEDFDIFPDAGEYVPAYLRGEEKESIDPEKTTDGYFSNLSASLTEAEREARRKEREVEDAWKETLKKAAAAQSQAEQEEAMRARAAKLAAAQDSYGEYQLGNDEDSDEDEEENSRKRKAAADAKKGGAAKDVDEEELTRRKKQKQGNKLENDLKKINKLIESKK